jgi:hypothetical protein
MDAVDEIQTLYPGLGIVPGAAESFSSLWVGAPEEKPS